MIDSELAIRIERAIQEGPRWITLKDFQGPAQPRSQGGSKREKRNKRLPSCLGKMKTYTLLEGTADGGRSATSLSNDW